jgi:hypothetical protein
MELLKTLRTLENHNQWWAEYKVRALQRTDTCARKDLLAGEVERSLEQVKWCQEKFALFLPREKQPRSAEDLFEVIWQREEAGWDFKRMAEHWRIQEASARALYQKARKVMYA